MKLKHISLGQEWKKLWNRLPAQIDSSLWQAFYGLRPSTCVALTHKNGSNYPGFTVSDPTGLSLMMSFNISYGFWAQEISEFEKVL